MFPGALLTLSVLTGVRAAAPTMNVLESVVPVGFSYLAIAGGHYCLDCNHHDCCCAGKFKAAELISFLSQQAGSALGSEADESAPQEPEEGRGQKQKQEEEQDPQIVQNLNVTEFEGLSDEEDAWLVAFYSGVCTSLSVEHMSRKTAGRSRCYI